MATTSTSTTAYDARNLVFPEAPEAEGNDDEADDNGLAALTPKQYQAIELLTQGQSVSATARALGIHRTTIHTWRRTDPTFALALRDSERDSAQHWRSATQARADKALTALDRLLDDERTPATVRLKAVLHVLNTATAPPPAAADPFEQDLLAREEQQRQREQRRAVIEQMLDDDEALEAMSDEEHQAPLYEGEPAEDKEEDESLTAALVARSQGIHHNSSLFASSKSVESPEKPKTVVYATPKPGRNQRCPCQSGRKYKHCCLPKA